MTKPFRILGYAIVSSDGMIADMTGLMPNSLIFEADKQFFERELDRAEVLVQGRNSYEYQANSLHRRRLVLTRQIPSLAPDPNFPRGFLWNPAGASFAEACRGLGVERGQIAILGGPHVYSLFLDMGFDVFYLCRAAHVALPGGVSVFPEVAADRTPEDVLAGYGLKPGPVEILDAANAITMVAWTREGG
jgi:dihydrofolate reductase